MRERDVALYTQITTNSKREHPQKRLYEKKTHRSFVLEENFICVIECEGY